MAERYIPEHRRSNFKAKGTFKQDELRRRREEQQVEIRKQKRDENLAKRRNLNLNSPPPGAGVDSDDESAGLQNQVPFFYFFCIVIDFLYPFVGFGGANAEGNKYLGTLQWREFGAGIRSNVLTSHNMTVERRIAGHD